jgi:hypothetical protein
MIDDKPRCPGYKPAVKRLVPEEQMPDEERKARRR